MKILAMLRTVYKMTESFIICRRILVIAPHLISASVEQGKKCPRSHFTDGRAEAQEVKALV